MSTISAYINFKNNCRAAMSFYQECLGGELTLMVVKDSPMAAIMPPHLQDIILHASLTNGELNLLGSEIPNNDGEVIGNSITMMLTCQSKNELLSKFEKLSAGGKVTHPVKDFFAGSICNLTDKFGYKWAVFSVVSNWL